ncbi:hypothetical protein ACFLXX_04400 [Chloroflexota bacterium]
MQPLDGAYQRVNRASEHLEDLKERIIIICQRKKNIIFPQVQPDFSGLLKIRKDGKPIIGATIGNTEFTEHIISILVGEVIYNMRAALDYLVYELACFDSKQLVDGTQFPIEDCVKNFDKRIGSLDDRRKGVFLRGISDKHVKAIKHLQPCDGCLWIKVLREISNPDKHRKLTIINSPVSFRWSAHIAELPSIQQSMHMYNGMSVQVVFDNSLPVIETLEQLHSEITNVLDLFKPEFK